jgi:hypothetical protein
MWLSGLFLGPHLATPLLWSQAKARVATIKAITPLYEGFVTSMLSATLLLLNLSTVHGVTHTFVDELFSLWQEELLPKNNKLPTTSYKAHKLIKTFGLCYDSIHTCVNGCVLFRGDYKHANVCPKCKTPRFMEGSRVVSRKVLRHFPFIPWLVRMYRCNFLAKLCTWHKNNVSTYGLVKSVPVSVLWKHITKKWLEFASGAWSIGLGLALNRVKPFGNLSSIHSTWPIVLLNYNLPPWFIAKHYFLMLAIIILGKKSCTSNNVDVYLQPLIEKL